ncbi:MAG: phage head-tail adapter protein [Proteobacteria bacterium]|nr:phage head-tail adapter protein [Pseudomonadota bacterium]
MIGVPQATLQQWLTQAQGAYQALMTGAMAQTVTYANGSGNRSVTYSKAQGSALYAHIRQLQTALGNTRPRRAARVQF